MKQEYISEAGSKSDLINICCSITTPGTSSNNNRLYATEILATLMLDGQTQIKFLEDKLIPYVLELCKVCLVQEVFYSDQKETFLNLFDVLECALLVPEAIDVFLEAEGMETMVSLLK